MLSIFRFAYYALWKRVGGAQVLKKDLNIQESQGISVYKLKQMYCFLVNYAFINYWFLAITLN